MSSFALIKVSNIITYFNRHGINWRRLEKLFTCLKFDITLPDCIPYKLRNKSSTCIFAFFDTIPQHLGVNLADLRRDLRVEMNLGFIRVSVLSLLSEKTSGTRSIDTKTKADSFTRKRCLIS